MTASTPVLFSHESEMTTENSISDDKATTIDITNNENEKKKMNGENEKSLSNDENDGDSEENSIDSLEKKDFLRKNFVSIDEKKEENDSNEENEKNSILLSNEANEVATTKQEQEESQSQTQTTPQSTIEIENTEDDETTETTMMTTTTTTATILDKKDDETSKKSEAKNAGEELENKNISEGFDTETERTTSSTTKIITTTKTLEDLIQLTSKVVATKDDKDKNDTKNNNRIAEMVKILQQIKKVLSTYAARSMNRMFDSKQQQQQVQSFEPEQSSSHIAESFILPPLLTSDLKKSQRAVENEENENVSCGDTQQRRCRHFHNDEVDDEMTMTSKLQSKRRNVSFIISFFIFACLHHFKIEFLF